MAKKKSQVDENLCVSCGCCIKVCPKDAIEVKNGMYAIIDENLCIGCGKCVTECPSSIIVGEYSKRTIRSDSRNGMIISGYFQSYISLWAFLI